MAPEREVQRLLFNRELGLRLHALRKARRLSQYDLARTVGVTTATLSRWETGECNPTFYNAVCLAEALGVRVTDLMAQPEPQSLPNLLRSIADRIDATNRDM